MNCIPTKGIKKDVHKWCDVSNVVHLCKDCSRKRVGFQQHGEQG